jgi:glutathione S-transferase
MEITLYEAPSSRAQRCRWVLDEVGATYESVSGRDVIGSDGLKKIHPLGKVPAVVIDGKPLIESAAICTYIADQFPEKGLIAKPGTWQRALHDQWVCFCLSEMEAWLWSTAMNEFVLPEEERIPAIFEQNAKLFSASAAVVDHALEHSDYLIDNQFSVTDIIMGFTISWANYYKLIEPFEKLQMYLDRLCKRPNSTLIKSST